MVDRSELRVRWSLHGMLQAAISEHQRCRADRTASLRVLIQIRIRQTTKRTGLTHVRRTVYIATSWLGPGILSVARSSC